MNFLSLTYKHILKILLLIIFFQFNLIFSQNTVDSLKKELADESLTINDKIIILNELSYFESYNNPQKGIDYAKQVIKLAIKSKNDTNKAVAYSNIAYCYWMLADYSNSNLYSDSAGYIYTALNDSTGIAEYHLNKGLTQYYEGKTIYSLQNYLKALEIAKKIQYFELESTCLINIGLFYSDVINDKKKALGYNLEAEKILEKIGKEYGILYSNIGSIYLEENELNKGFSYLEKSIPILIQENDSLGLCYAYINMCYYYKQKKQYAAALEYSENALSIFSKKENYEGILKAILEIVGVYKEKKNYNKALEYLNRALEIKSFVKSKDDINSIYEELGEINFELKNYALAYKYNKQFMDSTLSYINKTNIEKLTKIHAQYQTKEKEKENELLKSKVELQDKRLIIQKVIMVLAGLTIILSIVMIVFLLKKRNQDKKTKKLLIRKNKEIATQQEENRLKNEELIELNATKDKFFSIVAHDLKNPIGAANNFTSLLLSDYDKFNDEEKKEIISHIDSSIVNVNSLLQDLLAWAISSGDMMSINKQNVNINELFEVSIKPYEQLAREKAISFEKNVKDKMTICTDKLMLQTIIGNITNNAIKFSPTNSKIVLNSEVKVDSIIISIKDLGIGMNETQTQNLFDLSRKHSTVGTNGERGTGLGLVLVKEFVDKLSGNIFIESEVNKGTTFKVKLPIN